nr:MAG TPA: hypothetical protein [Caudoviricetes sp.]
MKVQFTSLSTPTAHRTQVRSFGDFILAKR